MNTKKIESIIESWQAQTQQMVAFIKVWTWIDWFFWSECCIIGSRTRDGLEETIPTSRYKIVIWSASQCHQIVRYQITSHFVTWGLHHPEEHLDTKWWHKFPDWQSNNIIKCQKSRNNRCQTSLSLQDQRGFVSSMQWEVSRSEADMCKHFEVWW